MPLLPSGYARSTPSPVNSPSNPPPSTHPSSSATVPAQTADGQNLPSMNQFPSQHSRGRGRITQTADGSTIHEFSRAEFESLLEDANHQRLTSLGFSNPQKNFCRTACDYSSAIYGGTSSEALMEHLADHAQRLLELGFTQNEITGLHYSYPGQLDEIQSHTSDLKAEGEQWSAASYHGGRIRDQKRFFPENADD